MSTLLFVHALGSSARAFEAQADALGDRHRVLVPDLPGHGAAPGAFTLDRATATVREQLAAADEPAHLVALSGGVTVALLAAMAEPARVAGLVLSGGAAHASGPGPLVQRIVLGLMPEAMLVRMLTPLYSGGQEQYRSRAANDLRRLGKRDFVGGLRELGRLDLRPRLAEIMHPALVLCGERDRDNIPYARELASSLTGAELRMVPEAGHLWNLERPEEFTHTVADFVERVDAG